MLSASLSPSHSPPPRAGRSPSAAAVLEHASGGEVAPPEQTSAAAASDARLVGESLERYPLLGCGVEYAETHDGVVWYRVAAHNLEYRWSFWTRFDSIDRLLHRPMQRVWTERLTLTARLPPFPEKRSKVVVDHLCRHFVRRRVVLLRHYLASLLASPAYCGLDAFAAFLRPGPHAHHLALTATTAADLEETRATHMIGSPPRTAGGGGGDGGEGFSSASPLPGARVSSYAAALAAECESVLSPRWFKRQQEQHQQRRRQEEGAGEEGSGGGEGDEGSGGGEGEWRRRGRRRSSHVGHGLGADAPEVTGVRIPTAQVLNADHVVYQVEVSNSQKHGNFSTWVVMKRYRDFATLRASVLRTLEEAGVQDASDLLPGLPRRRIKLVVDHLEHTFIEQRRLLLEDFLRTLIALPYIRTLPEVLEFVSVL